MFSFNESVGCISISSYWWIDNISIFVLYFGWSMYWSSSVFDRIVIDCGSIINSEGNISNSIPMLNKMFIHCITRVLVIDRAQNKNSSIMVFECMLSNFSFSCFKSFVCKILKSKSGSVEGCSLFCIANPKCDVV